MSGDQIRVFVEIPQGSRNKYEYNRETGLIELDRRVFASVSYPTEYGFVTETEMEDGEELDALVTVSEPTFPGCVVPARPVGLLRMDDGERDNPKVLCAPMNDPGWAFLESLDDLPDALRQEIEHFFKVYLDIEGKQWNLHGWGDAEEARRMIAEAGERYRKTAEES